LAQGDENIDCNPSNDSTQPMMGISSTMLRCLFPILLLLTFTAPAQADNPIIQTIYTADPAPLIYNNTIYLFADHDEDGATNFNNRDWRLFSSTDMSNWRDHGVVMNLATFSWANDRAWAGQVIPRNGKFYYYAPMQQKSGAMAIGVGVADNILGPYRDALGKPLVANNEIDPTVYIDDSGQAYLYWGNPGLWYVKLNQDMISYSGSIQQVQLTTAGFGTRRSGANARATAYEEGPWVYKRGSLWYLVYAANCCSEDIRYSTASSITGPWTYRGVIMASAVSTFFLPTTRETYTNSSHGFRARASPTIQPSSTSTAAHTSFTTMAHFQVEAVIPAASLWRSSTTIPTEPFQQLPCQLVVLP
jgi:arabinoxylan arabinofuranohydrolase